MRSQTPLTKLQRRFCEEYIIDLNATAAYRRAGYNPKSDEVAAVNASNALRVPKVQALIAQLQADRSKKTAITAERIVEELASIAFHRITDVMTVNVGIATVRDSQDWEADSHAAVSEIQGECNEGESVTAKLKVKTYDKMRALEMLAKIMGLLSDFDTAIATLKNYGLELKRDGATGKYYVAE